MSGADFILRVQVPNGDVRDLPLVGVLVLGRDPSADIRVADKRVSRRHVKFYMEGGKPQVADLGSSNGVKLNGQRLEGSAILGDEDEVRVGGCIIRALPPEQTGSRRVLSAPDATAAVPSENLPGGGEGLATYAAESVIAPLLEEASLIGLMAPVENRRFPLKGGVNLIGRVEQSEIEIADPSVSRKHAELFMRSDGSEAVLTDLNSVNGVFVNGRKVKTHTLQHHDAIRIGDIKLLADLPGVLPCRPSAARPKVSKGRLLRVSLLAVLGAALVVSASQFAERPAVGWFPSDEQAKSAETDDSVEVESAPPVVAKVEQEIQDIAPQPEFETGEPFTASFLSKTATAPYSPRGQDGLPLNLPPINPDFDYELWLKDAEEAADVAFKSEDTSTARIAAASILEIDPLHQGAQKMLETLAERVAAEEAVEKANRMVKAGQFADAYRVLSAVPESLPIAQKARKRATSIQSKAAKDAIGKGRQLSKNKDSWSKAHQYYVLAFELNPKNRTLSSNLRILESNMRRSNLSFESPLKQDEQRPLELKYGLDTPIVELYLRGQGQKALDRAQQALRNASGDRRRSLQDFVQGAASVMKGFSQVRSEITRNPSQAWARLLGLERKERAFLPPGEVSYLILELRADLSDAFAKTAELMLTSQRYEAAFQQFESGAKLDPKNARVMNGFDQLKRVAKRYLDDGRVAMRRGKKGDACRDFKLATRVTRSTTEVHKSAKMEASRVCP